MANDDYQKGFEEGSEKGGEVKPIIADLQIFKDLLILVSKIYQHEHCPEILKSYIRFEMGMFFRKDIDIKAFLEEKHDK